MASNIQMIDGQAFVERIVNNVTMSVATISHEQMAQLYAEDVKNAQAYFAKSGETPRQPYQRFGSLVTVDTVPFGSKGFTSFTHHRDGSVTRKDWQNGVLVGTYIAVGNGIAAQIEKAQAEPVQINLPF